MARITVEDCLHEVGDDNRFNLIHLAVKRIKQHRQGEPFLIEAKNKEVVMTLREIAAGEVTFHNVEELPELNDLDGLNDEQEPKEGEEA
ncbi:MAG: DNA-directed RNA polymerase subunit omega [Desulfobulbaceae bacterium]|nr:DNA-directed RNA polymerase subunit omega [Desulfofustis sp.]RZW19522.1 MAG: DNA-directed RNA polymerase subunit omega [Desulfobulbaceae bacterium]